MANLDFDPLFDNQKWEDRPVKDPVIVQREHDSTKLDRKLKKSSGDNRKILLGVHHLIIALLFVLGFIVVAAIIMWGFNYSFGMILLTFNKVDYTVVLPFLYKTLLNPAIAVL